MTEKSRFRPDIDSPFLWAMQQRGDEETRLPASSWLPDWTHVRDAAACPDYEDPDKMLTTHPRTLEEMKDDLMSKWERYAAEIAAANDSGAVWLVVTSDGWRAMRNPKELDYPAASVPSPQPTAKAALDDLYAKLLKWATGDKERAASELDRKYDHLNGLMDVVGKI